MPAQFKVEVHRRLADGEAEKRLIQAIFGGEYIPSPKVVKEFVVVQQRKERVADTHERAWAQGLAAKDADQEVLVERILVPQN